MDYDRKLLGTMAELIIRNGQVVDGTGAPAFQNDIVIEDGRIDLVGDASGIEADNEWDASGMTVCPGFIDIHSHSQYRGSDLCKSLFCKELLFEKRRFEPLIGPFSCPFCGFSPEARQSPRQIDVFQAPIARLTPKRGSKFVVIKVGSRSCAGPTPG